MSSCTTRVREGRRTNSGFREDGGGGHAEKRRVVWINQNKSTEPKSDRQKLAAIVKSGGGDGDGDKLKKSGMREAFVGCSNRRNGRCVSGSAVVSREAQWRKWPRHQSEATRSYSFLFPPGTGVRHTMKVAEAKANMEFGENSE